MKRLPTLVLLGALAAGALAAGCGCNDVAALEERGTDPDNARDERQVALHDALRCREPGVVPDLAGRAEALLVTTGSAERVQKDRQCALDVVAALVRAGEKSGPVLATRLGDPDSPFNRSRGALAVLARHTDPTVQGLAKQQLARLGPEKPKR